MGQPTVASSHLRRLLLRSLVVLCGAMAGTALAWLLSTGAASASQRDLTPLGPSPVPVPVAAIADVAGLDVITADVAGEDVAGTSRVKNAHHVEQVEQGVLGAKVQHLARDTADELLQRAPSVLRTPASLLVGRSPQAGRVADAGDTEPQVRKAVNGADADRHGDPDGQCHSCRCAPTVSRVEVSGRGSDAGSWHAFTAHDLAGREPVGLLHFPLGPLAPPASCSYGQCYGHANSGFADQSSVVTTRATATRAPRATARWAPLVPGDQPCTTPD